MLKNVSTVRNGKGLLHILLHEFGYGWDSGHTRKDIWIDWAKPAREQKSAEATAIVDAIDFGMCDSIMKELK